MLEQTRPDVTAFEPEVDATAPEEITPPADSLPAPADSEPAPCRYTVPRAVDPQPVPPGADLKHPALYFNQELSWIDFNWRVLHLAMDERTPLLERVRFVAITANNLDEFVQKRVGGLKRQEAAGVRVLSPDGRSPTGQLQLLLQAIDLMHRTMTEVWERTLKPRLRPWWSQP